MTQKNTNVVRMCLNLTLILIIIASSLLSNLVTVSQYTILVELTFIFYFHLLVPNAFPLWIVLLYGLLKDMLCIDIIGLYALLFTSFKAALNFQELDKTTASKWSLWIRFSLTLLVACLILVGAMSLIGYSFYNLLTHWLGTWMVTTLFYPLLAWVYSQSVRIIGCEHGLQ
jgi:hypothetical protein